ncbi:bifunctional 2-polyprenyl-6-hydroxyphenol methylase/3-demethylubiquinol 3-O-methyltransferase UbiG [Streptomyces cylindrosporus]|uniref:Class I SAM-dependent methyltransferase n=1 Tax=Streptomyces cylindrosporus TaxID=2927583 RepID=A0ABS9YQ12_9ACTN|nr:class I SAM-dependent methyltransferase [Streptomyces cylindrosporus]MCI3278939.1 class I SAM-dependent methyltransferase [Streptomyces cylindrosporus]
MPTLEPHRRRDIAESFGTDAERYDRARPRYPDALVRRIVDASPGGRVLDVGCGTGIVARQFQGAGCSVLGVEPDVRMAELARRLGTDVDVATFEEWEPGEGRDVFDVVVAGTAWHWVDLVAGAEKAARVLKPGGLLVPFWNVADLPADIAEAVADAGERVMPDSPFDFRAAATRSLVDGYLGFLAKAADGMRSVDGAFGEPEQWRYDWEFTYSRDAWLDVLPTQGAFTRLPPHALAEILKAVGAAIDARGGSVTMPYATLAVAARRT